MSEAPERIWASPGMPGYVAEGGCSIYNVEYVRADLLPVIKPLVWGAHSVGVAAFSDTGLGYVIDLLSDTPRWYSWPFAKGPKCSTLEEMKAAAQADYEARFRACLDMAEPAELVSGAYEAAARQLFEQHPTETAAAIRALTPADAQAALDAAIRKAVNEKMDEVANAARRRCIPTTLTPTNKIGYSLACWEIADTILAMKEGE